MLFAAADCPLCKRVLPDVMAFDSKTLRVVVIFAGRDEDIDSTMLTTDTSVPIITDPNRKLTVRYGVGVTPFAVAVDAHGVVRASGIVNDMAAIRYLAATVAISTAAEVATAMGGAR